MGDGRDQTAAPGRSSAAGADSEGAADAGRGPQAVGKQTLTEQLPGAGPSPVAGAPGAPPPAPTAKKTPVIPGTIIGGGPLTDAEIDGINAAAKSVPPQFKRYVAYASVIKVGGSLAWRANNPGNLREAGSKIGMVHGASGMFAVFATMADGRAAQKSLYETKYGSMTVKAAITKLTPPSENDTEKYLKQLASAGVDLDKDVASQIDLLMSAVEANEGMIVGTEVPRSAG